MALWICPTSFRKISVRFFWTLFSSVKKNGHLFFVKRSQSQPADDVARIARERVEKWNALKEANKKRRKACPYGCGKTWLISGISSISVRRHILGTSKKKCPKFPADGITKVKEFYHKKKRSSFEDTVS